MKKTPTEGSLVNGHDSFANDKWTFQWLIAGPSQDPFMLVDFKNDATALLFDCGIRIWGKVRIILKLKHLFITHAHIDHLIGFDHIIRSLLGENKMLRVHGPAGIMDKLTNRLAGYDWDKSAEQELVLEVNEYGEGCHKRIRLACNQRFARTAPPVSSDWNGLIVDEKRFQVHAVAVEHGGSPCHAYVMTEKDSARVDKDRLESLGVKPGPWVGELLQEFLRDRSAVSDDLICIGNEMMNRQRLMTDLVRVQKGRTLVYITDTHYDERWISELKSLAYGADLVVCESTFLEADEHLAAIYHHLTSVQAASVARELNACKLMLFHISSRYHPNMFQAVQEARRVFPRTDMIAPPRRTVKRQNR